ncbi:MAG: hypothetical protein JWO08_1258 [Verrucomicrobiaceae bacterium]|nr:hypothetical protein [Verrucomicrobiaceae bacterium]
MPTLVSTDATFEYQLHTAEEFLDWLEPGKHADLIGGEILMHSPVSLKHARLLNFLDRLLSGYLEKSKLGGELFREVVAVRLSARNVFEPDLSWFSPEQAAKLPATHAPFAPLWVCEALSPRTADRDVGPKFTAYEDHGVKEYWVLDPHTLRHRFYALEDDVFVEFAEQGDWIESRIIPGFKVAREWLNPEAMPIVGDCLAQLTSEF